MDIERTAQVSPLLSAQRTANTQQMKAIKMEGKPIEAEGQTALMLIQSVPLSGGMVGNSVNVKA